jgi:hypothetical protein
MYRHHCRDCNCGRIYVYSSGWLNTLPFEWVGCTASISHASLSSRGTGEDRQHHHWAMRIRKTEKTSHPGEAAFALCTLALLYGIHPVPAKYTKNQTTNFLVERATRHHCNCGGIYEYSLGWLNTLPFQMRGLHGIHFTRKCINHPEGQGVETETEKTSHPGQAAFALWTLSLLYGIHPVPAKCQSNPRKNKVMQKSAGAVPIRFRSGSCNVVHGARNKRGK